MAPIGSHHILRQRDQHMRHVMVELSTAVAAATLIASMVLAVGTAIDPPSRPIVLPSRPPEHSESSEDHCSTAPVTAQTGPHAIGHGTLCYDGWALRVVLHVSSLAPGVPQAVWLLHRPRRISCWEEPCPPTSLLGDSQGGIMEPIGTDHTSPSGDLQFHITSRDVGLQSGMEISVLLSNAQGKDQPHARVDFVIP